MGIKKIAVVLPLAENDKKALFAAHQQGLFKHAEVKAIGVIAMDPQFSRLEDGRAIYHAQLEQLETAKKELEQGGLKVALTILNASFKTAAIKGAAKHADTILSSEKLALPKAIRPTEFLARELKKAAINETKLITAGAEKHEVNKVWPKKAAAMSVRSIAKAVKPAVEEHLAPKLKR